VAYNARFAQVGSTMAMFVKVQIPSTISTISLVAMMIGEMVSRELTQNMKLDIPNNEDERISKCIMCDHVFSPMSTTK
jgi:hypothetical protein